MPLLRREPREVYRVYGAEEFLAGAEDYDRGAAPLPEEAAPPASGLRAAGGTRERSVRTLSAVILIAGVGAACGLIIARHMPSAGQSTGRRLARARPANRSAGAGGFAGVRPPAHPALSIARMRTAHRFAPRGVHNRDAALSAGGAGAPRPGPLPPVASGPTTPQPRPQLEFGFER